MQTLSVKIPPQHWNEQTRKKLAMQLYREGIISYVKARRLAGMREIEIHYGLNLRRFKV